MEDDELLYMCKTDFDHELGFAAGGNRVFPSLEDAKENLKCWRGCGIVAVRVTYVETVEPEMLDGIGVIDDGEVFSVPLSAVHNSDD